MKIELNIPSPVAELLAALDEKGNVKNVLLQLIDHAQQGVYRPGSWERDWISQVFYDFEDRLEPGDPFGRKECDLIFQKPKGLKKMKGGAK